MKHIFVSYALFLFLVGLSFGAAADAHAAELVWHSNEGVQVNDVPLGSAVLYFDDSGVGQTVAYVATDPITGAQTLHDINPPHEILTSYAGLTTLTDDLGDEFEIRGGVLFPIAHPTASPTQSPSPFPTQDDGTSSAGTATAGTLTAGTATAGSASAGSASAGSASAGSATAGGTTSSQDPPPQLPIEEGKKTGNNLGSVVYRSAFFALGGGFCSKGGAGLKEGDMDDGCSNELARTLLKMDSQELPGYSDAVSGSQIADENALRQMYASKQKYEIKNWTDAVGYKGSKDYELPGGGEGKQGELEGKKESGILDQAEPNILRLGVPGSLLKAVSITDVGVDDEIPKVALAMYQPISRLQRDFLGDEQERDQYLENALSVRGVAIMTMGFLDKTVGAGLTAIQQQADMNVLQHLSKQILWTTTRIARPDKAQAFIDTDEKLEACLAAADDQNKAPKKQIKRKQVNFQCHQRCGPPPEGTKRPYREPKEGPAKGAVGQEPKHGNGSYRWCVCCAEAGDEQEVNNTFVEGQGKTPGSVEKNQWSLVERMFAGTRQPKGDSEKTINALITRFKDFYGDYVLRLVDDKGADSDSKDPYQSISLMMPRFSAQKIVRAFFNGCYVPTDPKDYELGKTGGPNGPCELESVFKFKKGICPAFINVLKNWDEIVKGGKGFAADEIEASMGLPIDGGFIRAVLTLNGAELNKLKGEPTGVMRRSIYHWCMASASAAAEKHHAEFAAFARRFTTLSRQTTTDDKEKFMYLINRALDELAAEKRWAMSTFIVEAGATVIARRTDVIRMAQAAASTAAGMRDFANLGYATTITDNQEFYANQGGGSSNKKEGQYLQSPSLRVAPPASE